MKTICLLIFIIFSTSALKSQERFFEFLPGWKNLNIAAKGNKYISFGTTSDGINLNHYQFSSFSLTGELVDAWEFDLDTITVFQSRYVNDVSTLSQSNYITGTLKGLESNRFYGTMTKFNDDFSDTLSLYSFNILPGNGTMIWSHLAVNPNKFILGGFLQNTDFQVYSSLMQSDSLGNIAWRKNYFCGNDCELYPNHILQASDGGYFFTCAEGHFKSNGSVLSEKTAIIKTDSLGNVQYRLHPGQPENYAVRGWVLPTDDGHYITAYSDPFLGVLDENPQVNDESTIWLNKFDVEGNELFDISLIDFLPLTDFGNRFQYTIYQMLRSEDNQIIIVGTAGVRKGFILKVSEEGELDWFRIITPPQSEGNDAGGEYTRVYGVTPTSDGGYIMAGEYFSSPGNIYPEGIQTAIAVKVDSLGCLVAGCDTLVGIAEIPKVDLGLQVYPNPASELVNITVSDNVRVEKIRVYEVMGRVVLVNIMNENKMKIDVGNLSPGMYLLEVETKDGLREIKRFLIE